MRAKARRLAIPLGCALLVPVLAGWSCQSPQVAFVRDAQGRALILHGVNIANSAKRDPQRMPWVTSADVQRLAQDWGFNFVRFLIFWDAVEPSPGVYDDAYLDRVAQRLDWIAQAGLLAVLDMHQDVYSSVFCCDGAPAWAVIDDGLPFAPQPYWGLNYFQPAVIRAFDNFFHHAGAHPELQDHYVAAWAHVAARLAGHPALLGYDIMNEPYYGSTSPELFEATLLADFYRRVIAALRSVDSESWIFLEPVVAVAAAGGPSGLVPIDDPRPGADRLVYFPHLYPIGVELSGNYSPSDRSLELWARHRVEEAHRLGMPVVLGEFGLTDSVVNGSLYLRDALRMADRVTSGWAYWDYGSSGYGFLQPDGSEKSAKTDLLVRTYPQRVAGDPLWYDYDPATRVLWLAIRERPGVSGPTEIYVPAARHYPNGWHVESSDPPGSWSASWDPTREVLSLRADPAQAEHLVCVAPTGVSCFPAVP